MRDWRTVGLLLLAVAIGFGAGLLIKGGHTLVGLTIFATFCAAELRSLIQRRRIDALQDLVVLLARGEKR